MSELVVENLSAGYGAADIIHDISLRIKSGQILTIAGTNGSGKSTLVKAIMGLVPRVDGSISLEGNDLLALPPEARVGHGLGYVPQVENVFATLTVDENLAVVEYSGNRQQRMNEMYDRFPALAERKTLLAGNLSGGERQQLAFARALMLKPQFIVLDEPTAALSIALVEQVFDLIKKLPETGIGILLVEQRARLALEISDNGLILDQGRIVLAGEAKDLLNNKQMAELYLGHAQN